MLSVIIRGFLSYPLIVLGKAINDFGAAIAGISTPVRLAIVYHPKLGFCLKRTDGKISSWQDTSDEAFRMLRFEVDRSQQDHAQIKTEGGS